MKDRTRERFDLFMDIYGNNLRELAYWVMADEQGGWHGNTHAMPLTLKDADADARQPSLLIDSFKAVPLQALPPDAQEYWQSEMTQNKPGRCLALLHYTKPDGKQAGTYVSYTSGRDSRTNRHETTRSLQGSSCATYFGQLTREQAAGHRLGTGRALAKRINFE